MVYLNSFPGEVQINVGTLWDSAPKNLSSFVSVKNQVAGRVDVVEDGGAEVERRREGEEGLEGP